MNSLFEKISDEYSFSPEQKNQYLLFITFLQTENEKYNLTRISTMENILYHHLIDTLEITKLKLLDESNTIFDIGSGGGIPGILLAIFYPQKNFYLNEVTTKKVHFLQNAVNLLNLSNCCILRKDFLSIIRQKNITVDTFIARASIPLYTIIEIYNYKLYDKTNIIYWVGTAWQANKNHNSILTKKNIAWIEYQYTITDPKNIKNHIYLTIKKLTKKT